MARKKDKKPVDPWQLTRHHRKPKAIGGKKDTPKNIAKVPRNIHEAWNDLQGILCTACFEARFVPFAKENGYIAEFYRKTKPLHAEVCGVKNCPLAGVNVSFTPKERAAFERLKKLVADDTNREPTFFGTSMYISRNLLDSDGLMRLTRIPTRGRP